MPSKPERRYPRGWRIASLVRRGLSPLLSPVHGGVTIRRVSLNGDFSVATVYYSVLSEKSGETVSAQEILSRNAVHLRRRLASSLNMRATPKLVFAPDEEGIAADEMQNFLNSIPSGTPF